MLASLLQLAGLIGLPVGGYITAGAGGAVLGVSVVAVYVGLALDRGES